MKHTNNTLSAVIKQNLRNNGTIHIRRGSRHKATESPVAAGKSSLCFDRPGKVEPAVLAKIILADETDTPAELRRKNSVFARRQATE